MPYTPKSKFDLPKDAPAYMNDFATQLRNELLAISRTVVGNNATTLIITGTDGSTVNSGGSSGSTSTSTIKSGTQFVTAATAAWVTFPATFTTIPVVTLCFIAGTDGSFGSINTANLTITKTGFSIPALDIMVSGTIFYIATVNS